MPERPTEKWVICPECNAEAITVVPKHSEIVESEETADGKAWVSCWTCGERFLVYYRTQR